VQAKTLQNWLILQALTGNQARVATLGRNNAGKKIACIK
jgi:hypothetical protein